MGGEIPPDPTEDTMVKKSGKKSLNNILDFLGGALPEQPSESYGYTEPKQKGFTSGSQLFPADGRAMEYRSAQRKTNNEVRVNGGMVNTKMNFFGWSD
jgi:hypothetical protein|tara:strand:+ start:379 stop:672 length:294 start_codon:yes stop_codon:yes gene_type:complete